MGRTLTFRGIRTAWNIPPGREYLAIPDDLRWEQDPSKWPLQLIEALHELAKHTPFDMEGAHSLMRSCYLSRREELTEGLASKQMPQDCVLEAVDVRKASENIEKTMTSASISESELDFADNSLKRKQIFRQAVSPNTAEPERPLKQRRVLTSSQNHREKRAALSDVNTKSVSQRPSFGSTLDMPRTLVEAPLKTLYPSVAVRLPSIQTLIREVDQVDQVDRHIEQLLGLSSHILQAGHRDACTPEQMNILRLSLAEAQARHRILSLQLQIALAGARAKGRHSVS